MQRILAELQEAFEKLPEDAVNRIVCAVNAHERIFVYAAGRSGLMLKAFAMRLAQMGRTVYVVGETVTPAIEAEDLLVLASASGSTQSVCRYAQIAKDIGADILIITAAACSDLTRIYPASVVLPAASKDSAGGSVQVMGSLFEQLLLLLVDGVAAHMACDAGAMRRRHANLE